MNRRSEGLISILNPNGEPNTGLALSSKQKAIIAALQYPGHPLQELAEDVAWFN